MYDDSYDDRGYGDDRRPPGRRRRPDYGDDYDDDYGHGPQGDQDRRRGAPPPPRKAGGPTKISYKCIGGLVVALVALIMIFIFMSYPWYELNYSHTVENKSEYDREIQLVFHLDEMESEYTRGNDTLKSKISYDDPIVEDSFKEVKEVMDYTYYFYLIAAVMLIIAMAFIPIVALGKLPHVIGLIFLLLALVFVLIIPLYFYFALPPAIESTFDKTTWEEPINNTFRYNKEFLSSGRGNYPYDVDYDDEDEDIQYKLSWGPGLGFWFVFIPLITIVVAQAVYSAGKHDLARSKRPPPRGFDYDQDQGYGERPPARRRDYDSGAPPPPPRQRQSQSQSRRDYGPPRPMADDDYNYINKLQSTRDGGDDRGYDPRPPPRPPRRP